MQHRPSLRLNQMSRPAGEKKTITLRDMTMAKEMRAMPWVLASPIPIILVLQPAI